jgi:hypothetical protein
VAGIVIVPTPVPSAPIGKLDVPVRVIPVPVVAVPKVTVNSAPVASVASLSTVKPATVTVKASPGLTVVGESVTDLAVRENELSDLPTRLELSVAVNTIVLLIPLPEVSSSIGKIVV